ALPEAVGAAFSTGMAQTMLLPAAVLAVALVAALFLTRHKPQDPAQ
ncbi:hypothetical protein G3H63_19120, partial [Microbacterium resistens]|nr:hypothetical protein [Microbacterium resistens]